VFAHDLFGALAVIKQAWISNLAFELFDAFSFELDE
jgi:hypothetical protein